jgi:hypothetical protein
MSIKFAKKQEMQSDAAEAVSDNPKLPRMDEKELRPSRIKGAVKLMEEAPKPAKGGKDYMAPASKAKPSAKKGRQPRGDQEARKTARRTPESYLRLRVHVENGEMSVLDVKEVEGPLAMPDAIPTGFAYEVTLGAKRVAVGSIPDLGTWRGYPRPGGEPGVSGQHHLTPMTEAEFNVRVPRTELSMSALPRTEIALYQVKEEVSDQPLGLSPLDEQFSRELREIARLKGIHVEKLSKPTQKKFRQALK